MRVRESSQKSSCDADAIGASNNQRVPKWECMGPGHWIPSLVPLLVASGQQEKLRVSASSGRGTQL